jgi:transcriptional regulator GlxA family with amidase domain
MQNLPTPKSFPITIDFLVYDRFSNHCMANTLEPFRAANTLSANDVYEWNFVTLDGLSVQSSSELRLMPDQKFGETKRADFLFIIASYDFRRHDSEASRRALRAAMKRYKNIIGLDSGPWMMAGAGIIDNYRATAHWDIIDEFSEEFVEVNVERQKYIFDGNIGTCGGGMAAFDLSLSIIREINGVTVALDVASMFLSGADLPQEYRTNTVCKIHEVQKALEIMHENIEDILTIPSIANKIGISSKQLHRFFLKDLGQSPKKVYLNIRLSFGRHLLQATQKPINEVALRSGYENVSAFSRAFKMRFDQTPSKYRNHFN